MFEHSTFDMSIFGHNVYILRFFGTKSLYVSMFHITFHHKWNSISLSSDHKSRPSEGNHQAIKDNFCQLTILISVAKTSTGDSCVTTSFCLSMCISNPIAYILQMARSNVFNCTFPGTKLLNNYPTFKEVSTE